MKKNCLYDNQIFSLTKLVVGLIILMLIFFTSCSETERIELEVAAFQQQVDSILVHVIVPKKDSLHAQIGKSQDLSQESIDIAYQVIPINTAQFLISSQSDTLKQSLKLFKSRKIKAVDLKKELAYTKFYVDSILMSNVVLH